MSNDNEIVYPVGSIGASGDEQLIRRITEHHGSVYLTWTAADISRILDCTDPRSEVGWNAIGDMSAMGGSGPKKTK